MIIDYWFPDDFMRDTHTIPVDRSRFLRMMLFINNTKNTFYETKVLKTKQVSFLKYIYKLIMLY
jgi:hypothetical protein